MNKSGELGTGMMAQLIKSLSYEQGNPTLVSQIPHLNK